MDQILTEPQRASLAQRTLARPLSWAAFVVRAMEKTLWPLLDLVIRLWLAQVFFVSGVLKAANWENALNLAANEYPVSWLDPVSGHMWQQVWFGASKQFRDLGRADVKARSLRAHVDRLTVRKELSKGVPAAKLKAARASAKTNERSSTAWAKGLEEEIEAVAPS